MPGDDGGVWVCWDPVEGAQYMVLRADAVEGPYEPVSGLLELPEFLDEEAPEGGAFYRVELVIEEPGSRERDLPAEDPEEVYAEITALMDQGRYQEAADLAEAFLAGYSARDMARQKIHHQYGLALLRLREYADSRTEFARLLADYPDADLNNAAPDFFVDDAKYRLGWLELHAGDPQTAHDDLMKFAGDYGESDRAIDALFLANRALIDHIDNGVKRRVDPALYDAPVVDKRQEILANLDRVLSQYPADPLAPQMLADYLIYLVKRPRRETETELVATAERILTEYPDSPSAKPAIEELTDYRILWGDEGDRQLAAATLDGLISEAEERGNVADVLHWSYYRAKLFRRERAFVEAETLIESCLERDPGFLPYEFRLQLAFVYHQQGRDAEAVALLERMRTLHSSSADNESLARYLAALYSVDLGRIEEAAAKMDAIATEYAGTSTGQAARQQAGRLARRLAAR